jgi:hypothetical protein
MSTIAKAIASVAVLSALAVPASARFDANDSVLSADATFGVERAAQGATILINRPIHLSNGLLLTPNGGGK